MRIIWMLFLATLVTIAAAARAQTSRHDLFHPVPRAALRDLEPDRPNATNSPSTIDAGWVQVEAGAFNSEVDRERGERDRTWLTGEVNVRVGVLDALELNIDVQPHVAERARDADGRTLHRRGFGDVIVGGKLNLWGNGGGDATWSTALAIQPQVTLPTARHGLGAGQVEAAVAMPFTLALPAGFGLAVQPALSRIRDAAGTGYTIGYEGAVALDHGLGPLDAYLEFVVDDTSERGQPHQSALDLGATAAVSRQVALDAGVAIGLGRAAPDLRVLAGATARF